MASAAGGWPAYWGMGRQEVNPADNRQVPSVAALPEGSRGV